MENQAKYHEKSEAVKISFTKEQVRELFLKEMMSELCLEGKCWGQTGQELIPSMENDKEQRYRKAEQEERIKSKPHFNETQNIYQRK